MMEANAAVGGGVEECAPEQRLPFRFGPVGKDVRGVENAVRPAPVQRSLGCSDGARTGQGKGERETLRPEPRPSVGENTPIGSIRVILQLGRDVRLVLLRPRAEPPLALPSLDQLSQIQGAAGKGPSVPPGDLREKRGRVVYPGPLHEEPDLLVAHRKHGDRAYGTLIRGHLVFAVGADRLATVTPERIEEHVVRGLRGNIATARRHRQPVLHRGQVEVWAPVTGTARDYDPRTMTVSVDRLRQSPKRPVELSPGKLQLVHRVEEEPDCLAAVSSPCVESLRIGCGEEIDNRLAIEGLERNEEGEPPLSGKALRLFGHLHCLAGPRLRQQDDAVVLQQVRPTDAD